MTFCALDPLRAQLAATALCFLGVPAPAQCPEWSDAFSTDGIGGWKVEVMAVHQGDLILAGPFKNTGNGKAQGLARWDGTRFHPIGTGLVYWQENYLANDLLSFDDGTGPNLFYASPMLAKVNGKNANGLARWDGVKWRKVSNLTGFEAHAFAVFDDGGGPDLYVGGEGDWSTNGGLHRYGSGNLVSVESCGPDLYDLIAWDDGTGPALYAAGDFPGQTSCPTTSKGVSRWDGTAWSPLGAGLSKGARVLAVHDDGTGEQLYVAGGFSQAGSVQTGGLARWDGTTWSDVGGVWSGSVSDMQSLGGMLYVATGTGGVRAWDGMQWSNVFSTTLDAIALAAFDEGGGPNLFVGGEFTSVDGVPARNVLRSSATGVTAVGGGEGLDGDVLDLIAWDDGGGTRLYAGGYFHRAGTLGVDNVASWDGSSWSPLGEGVNDQVRDFLPFDSGAGPELVVAGDFTLSGSQRLTRIGRWDGSSWAPMGTGMDDQVRALEVFDDGGGERLFAVGAFVKADGATAHRVAAWDGASWSQPFGTSDTVRAIQAWDDGSGPALFIGGEFTMAGGNSTKYVAKWDGTTVTPLGTGLYGPGLRYISAFAVFDDGQGEALYAGGRFTQAGGVWASNVAKWDGTSWWPLGPGVDGDVRELMVYDDGSGAKLMVGGSFQNAGGLPVSRLAAWDGITWSTPGGATKGVFAMESYASSPGTWPSLFIGGTFVGGSSTGMHHIGELSDPCAGSSTSYCTAGTSASGCRALMSSTGVASSTAPSGFVVTASGVEGVTNGLFFFGLNGRQANPWGNGTSYVCVIPPRWRGGLQQGGGTQGGCDGSISQDLNARWCPTCPKPNHNPPAGAMMQAQLWYRDPLSTSNQTSSMSDAIEFRVAP